MRVEQQVQAHLISSAMHRAEREVFDAWEELTNAVGMQMEGRRRDLDLERLKAQLRDAEAKAWECVNAGLRLALAVVPCFV